MARERGRFVEIETTKSRITAPSMLTLRFHDEDYPDYPVLRIGFRYDADDKEVCWLDKRQARLLLKALREEFGDADAK